MQKTTRFWAKIILASLILWCGLFFTVASCAQLKAAGIDGAVCALSSVSTDVPSVLNTVKTILVDGSATWQAQLEGLGTKLGLDVVFCAVKAALDELQAVRPGTDLSEKTAGAVARGKSWIAEHEKR